jgi:hypothetical protein
MELDRTAASMPTFSSLTIFHISQLQVLLIK